MRADENARLNILFIGNSLTNSNDLPGLLEALIDSTDFGPVHIESIARGSYALEDHWKYTIAPKIIARGGWDIVVIQQGPSASEGGLPIPKYSRIINSGMTKSVLRAELYVTEDRTSLLKYAKSIDAEVTKQVGRTALFQVWPAGYRLSDYDGVCASYRTAAEQIDGLLFPVGEAFRMARRRHTGLSLLQGDDFHPNPNGTYLAALVMFQQVTGRSPLGLPVNFNTPQKDLIRIAPETATMLQKVAAEANAKFALN